jgi:hypothetical protein
MIKFTPNPNYDQYKIRNGTLALDRVDRFPVVEAAGVRGPIAVIVNDLPRATISVRKPA